MKWNVKFYVGGTVFNEEVRVELICKMQKTTALKKKSNSKNNWC